jgi:hypothetical protein
MVVEQVNTLDLYMGGAPFKYWQQKELSLVGCFVDFLSFQSNAGTGHLVTP